MVVDLCDLENIENNTKMAFLTLFYVELYTKWYIAGKSVSAILDFSHVTLSVTSLLS